MQYGLRKNFQVKRIPILNNVFVKLDNLHLFSFFDFILVIKDDKQRV